MLPWSRCTFLQDQADKLFQGLLTDCFIRCLLCFSIFGGTLTNRTPTLIIQAAYFCTWPTLGSGLVLVMMPRREKMIKVPIL